MRSPTIVGTVLFVAREFAVFFLIVLPIAWLLRQRPVAWKMFMLAASLFFYGWWRHGANNADWSFLGTSWVPRYACYLLIFALVNYLLGNLADTAAAKFAVVAACVFDLGALFYFKYFVWTASTLNSMVGTNLQLDTIILPIGVSFIAFQGLGYVIDVSRGTTAPVDMLDFFTYLFFFPHVVAGPLVRVTEFVPQLHRRADPRHVEATRAFTLIASGFVKKVIISWLIADWIVKPVFANPKGYGALDNIVAMYGFAIQIYCDFSGYTDIAIGLALLLGIQFPQNFNRPYRALSIQDFWRRWHMTLSRWLRDYLYIGLGGNRRGETRMYVNLFLTMLIGGLWHGADWTFVIWGAIHGGALVIERFLTGARPVPAGPGAVVRWFITFNVVCFGWVFFNAGLTGGGFSVAKDVLTQMVTGWGTPSRLVNGGVLLLIAVVLASQFVPEGLGRRLVRDLSAANPLTQTALIGVGLGATMIACYHWGSTADFIYFSF